MERYFILDKKNTWYDWRLVLTAKDVTPPTPKTNYVKIDGMSGSLDLSESLTGEITYEDRTITASFWTSEGTRKERDKLLKDIIATLHGKKIKIIEPDDPERYFYGRVKVNSISNTLSYASFSIEATCDPWRYAINESTRTAEVYNTSLSLVINNNGVKTLSPIITVTGSVDVTYKGVKSSLTDGTYKISDIRLYRGSNVIDVSGTGSVSFTYREADL